MPCDALASHDLQLAASLPCLNPLLQPELLSALVRAADGMLRQFGPQVCAMQSVARQAEGVQLESTGWRTRLQPSSLAGRRETGTACAAAACPQELTNTAWALSQMHRSGVPFTPDVVVSLGWAGPRGLGCCWEWRQPTATRVAFQCAQSLLACTRPPAPTLRARLTHACTHRPAPPSQALLDRIPDELSLLFADRSWRARVKPQTISNLANACAEGTWGWVHASLLAGSPLCIPQHRLARPGGRPSHARLPARPPVLAGTRIWGACRSCSCATCCGRPCRCCRSSSRRWADVVLGGVEAGP